MYSLSLSPSLPLSLSPSLPPPLPPSLPLPLPPSPSLSPINIPSPSSLLGDKLYYSSPWLSPSPFPLRSRPSPQPSDPSTYNNATNPKSTNRRRLPYTLT